MHANGDLVIMGEDDQNNQKFLMVIKANQTRNTNVAPNDES
jgi:hypothetical protein